MVDVGAKLNWSKFFAVFCFSPFNLIVSALLIASTSVEAETVYQEPKEFLAEVFNGNVPTPTIISITGERREKVGGILGRTPSMLRVRYWFVGDLSAWILEEIGKTEPITTGILIRGQKIEDVRILIYRESHGSEVRHDFFTEQFRGTELDSEGEVTKKVDGISGATMSVNALRKLAKLALYLNREAIGERR